VAGETGGAVDGVVAVAGIGRPDASTVRLNYFGALATSRHRRSRVSPTRGPLGSG
jgi:hypothetical protein